MYGRLAQFQGIDRLSEDATVNAVPAGAEETAPWAQNRPRLAF